MAKSLTFWLPFIPSASKNQKTFVKGRNGQMIPIPRARVRDQWKKMGQILHDLEVPDFGDDELELQIDVDPVNERCLVRVRSLGPLRAKHHSGRGRDVDNILVTVADGLQLNKVIANDRQIRRVRGERWAGGIVGAE